ncbi:MAG TPA: PilZ domain-containing protein [Alphaproteobacteria bacterium]|nr:PilZ domain-containing protein [Alphaproteobacteria bacterium]
MAQPQPEKRSTRRFALDLPITLKFSQESPADVGGHTRDVSSRGVFIYVDSRVAEGDPLEFVMTLPPEITLADPIRVRCKGKVVRIEKNGTTQGIAVAIDKYDFVGEE